MAKDGLAGGEVVPLAEFRKDMRFHVISEVRAYWEALRNGRTVPLRSEVDPRGIERALEYAFILERIAPQIARFRLAGMHLNDLMGMEVRGMPLTACFSPRARARVSELLEGCFTAPQVAELTLSAESGLGKPPLVAKLLILPLKSDLGDVSRALGCLIAHGQIGRTPRRFDLAEERISPVVAGLPIETEVREPAIQPPGLAEPLWPFRRPPLPAFAPEPAAARAPEPTAATPEERRARLRVIQGAD